VVASRLAHLVSATLLLPIALGITAVGLPLFWLAPLAPLSMAGLFIAGLGIANLYPFTIARAIGVEPAHADTAAARLSLAVGASILITPLILGWVADLLDIRRAFGIVAVLLLLAVATTILATYLTARHARGLAAAADRTGRRP
jgi:fucose permease